MSPNQIEAKTAKRIANTNAMLAVLEAAPTYSEYMALFGKIEHRLHGLPGMSWEESQKAWREFDRIASIKSAQWRAEYNAIRLPVTLEDLAARRAKADSSATDAMLAKISALHADTASMSAPTLQAAE